MMQIQEEENHARFVIHGYQAGESITVNENTHTRSLIITPQKLISDWAPQQLNELTVEHWQPILELAPEIVLIGTGQSFELLKPALLAPLYEKHIGVECMDTGAACRTYCALLAEGRNVAAALLIH